MTYQVKENLKPSNLEGVSAEQIDQHWALYSAYVAQSNTLKDELEALRAEGKGGTPNYADRRRRFGFEFAGMVLHEYYFGNLKAGVSADAAESFKALVSEKWGSFEAWQEDFVNTGKTRGIGWAICALDPETGDVNNHFIQLHEDGNIPGYHPLLVMDVWEHAYMVDYKATARPDYINAFMANVNWETVESRLAEARGGKTSRRAA